MNAKVKISDILEVIDFQWDDETLAYLENSTKKVWVLKDDIIEAAEENNKEKIMSYYEDVDFEAAKRIIKSPDDFIVLPDKYDLDEYSIMENFCYSIEDDDTKKLAFSAIKGKGAFRRFKDLMQYHGLIDAWYKYREKAIKQKAVDWCENNDILYEDGE